MDDLKKSLADANRRYADLAMAFEMLGDFTDFTDIDIIFDRILTLFKQLFSPKKIEFLKLDTDSLDLILIKNNEKQYYWDSRENIFLLQFQYDNSLLAVIKLTDIAFPEHINRYLNTAFIISKISSLAIHNAIIYTELISEIREKVKAQNDLKEFISMVSHELRTPITVFKSSLDLLDKYEEKLSSKDKEELFEGIKSNTVLMAELIEDLLIVSQVDENKIKLKYSDCNLREIISEVFNLLEPRRKSKNIIFKLECDDLDLKVDKRRINQVIRILVDNSLKYSNEEGTIEINVTDNYKGEFNALGLEGALIEIRDRGIGISKQEQTKLFQRYFRSESVKNIAGTGLGLYIAKEFISLHEGSINVMSKLGEGTSFFIFLPNKK